MRFLVFLITAICLLIVSNTFAQDVAVFYDAAVEGGRGLAVNNPAQLADMMVKELKARKLTADVVDSYGRRRRSAKCIWGDVDQRNSNTSRTHRSGEKIYPFP